MDILRNLFDLTRTFDTTNDRSPDIPSRTEILLHSITQEFPQLKEKEDYAKMRNEQSAFS